MDKEKTETKNLVGMGTSPYLPKSIQLAEEHWTFIGKWLGMVYKDSFIHGYKHGEDDAWRHVEQDAKREVIK